MKKITQIFVGFLGIYFFSRKTRTWIQSRMNLCKGQSCAGSVVILFSCVKSFKNRFYDQIKENQCLLIFYIVWHTYTMLMPYQIGFRLPREQNQHRTRVDLYKKKNQSFLLTSCVRYFNNTR